MFCRFSKVLHHVGIELHPAEMEAAVDFFELIGFERVEPPATLREYTWLEREGTQVHLMPEEEPAVPSPGHIAVVAPTSRRRSPACASAGSRSSRNANTGASRGRWRSRPGATGSS
jgi:hypothetical protein